MRFVGETEVFEFLGQWPDCGPPVRAWLSEIKYRDWDTASALQADFRFVDISSPPVIVFRLQAAAVRIVTVVDFRRRTVLLTAIRQDALAASNSYRTVKQ